MGFWDAVDKAYDSIMEAKNAPGSALTDFLDSQTDAIHKSIIMRDSVFTREEKIAHYKETRERSNNW